MNNTKYFGPQILKSHHDEASNVHLEFNQQFMNTNLTFSTNAPAYHQYVLFCQACTYF